MYRLYEQSDTRKNCPLRQPDPEVSGFTQCREERCAWWLENKRRCAVVEIAAGDYLRKVKDC